MSWWKWVGLAGVAGFTATGVAVARAERRRRAYTPEQVRERLHARLAAANASGPQTAPSRPPDRDDRSAGGSRLGKLAKRLRRPTR